MFVAIDPTSFEVRTTQEYPLTPALIVPVHPKMHDPDDLDAYAVRPWMAEVVYKELYTAVEREDRRRGLDYQYELSYPDPWLIALAAIMWEGIVQGLTWDAVKISVINGLNALRARGLAPPEQITSETRMRFRWIGYGEDGNKRRELFFDLKRRRDSMTEGERRKVSESLRAPSGNIFGEPPE